MNLRKPQEWPFLTILTAAQLKQASMSPEGNAARRSLRLAGSDKVHPKANNEEATSAAALKL